MTADAVMRQARAEGVHLSLGADGAMIVKGDQGAVARWIPVLREQKAAIVTALLAETKLAVCPAATNARPVYWERGDQTVYGPAQACSLGHVGSGLNDTDFWLCVDFEGHTVWVRSDRLRSRRDFEQQRPLLETDLIRESVT